MNVPDARRHGPVGPRARGGDGRAARVARASAAGRRPPERTSPGPGGSVRRDWGEYPRIAPSERSEGGASEGIRPERAPASEGADA